LEKKVILEFEVFQQLCPSGGVFVENMSFRWSFAEKTVAFGGGVFETNRL
jgi:hypothetical protein